MPHERLAMRVIRDIEATLPDNAQDVGRPGWRPSEASEAPPMRMAEPNTDELRVPFPTEP